MTTCNFDGLSPENRIDDSILDKISGGSGQMDTLDFGDEGSQNNLPSESVQSDLDDICKTPGDGMPRPSSGGLIILR